MFRCFFAFFAIYRKFFCVCCVNFCECVVVVCDFSNSNTEVAQKEQRVRLEDRNVVFPQNKYLTNISDVNRKVSQGLYLFNFNRIIFVNVKFLLL